MKHHAALMAAESILNRDFGADRPLQKMGSDITYIPMDEGGSVTLISPSLATVLHTHGRRGLCLAS